MSILSLLFHLSFDPPTRKGSDLASSSQPAHYHAGSALCSCVVLMLFRVSSHIYSP